MSDLLRELTAIVLTLIGMGMWGYVTFTQEERIAYLEKQLERNLTK